MGDGASRNKVSDEGTQDLTESSVPQLGHVQSIRVPIAGCNRERHLRRHIHEKHPKRYKGNTLHHGVDMASGPRGDT